jgi:hypothetical protein
MGRGSSFRRGMRRGAGALLVLALAGLALYALAGRAWMLRWGATDPEVTAPLPGDELTANPRTQSTRAITVHAPAAAIWPWLAQIGQGRGGFYSYDALENLIGCDIHSADRIVPEWQQPAVGDLVRMYRPGGGPPPYEIARIEPGAALVLGHRGPAPDLAPGAPWADSWAFTLRPVDATTTRLVIRGRSLLGGASLAAFYLLVDPPAFLMERGMLQCIKARAEAKPAPVSAAALRAGER